MPTKNPRLTITLEPTLAAHLRRLSELTGDSQSKILSEMLEGSIPVLERLILVLEAANKAKQSIKGKVGDDMSEAQGRIEKHLGLILDDFDGMTAPLLKEADVVQKRGRKASGGLACDALQTTAVPDSGVVTPPSNRGVRFTANPKKRTKRGAGNGQV